jgi:hypothetical protein
MTTLHINKKQVVDQFLNPVSRISEECSLSVSSDDISTLINDSTGAIILYSKLKTKTGLAANESITLNIKDLRKLIKIFECIPDDEFDLKIGDNASTITHKSPTLSFKLHLVLDNVIKKCTVSLDKIIKLKFDSDFELTSAKIGEVLKGSIFTSNADKVYFYTKDGAVYAELTDKANHDIDSITFNLGSQYNGADVSSPLPFNLEILRLINSVKCDKLTVKINNTYKILLFEICTPDVMFKYIIPGYTK